MLVTPLLIAQMVLGQAAFTVGDVLVVPDPGGTGHASSNLAAGVGSTLCAFGARGLYSARPDVFDGVVVFTTSSMSGGLLGNSATPKGTIVRATASGTGYGTPLIPLPASEYGSAGKLGQCVFMGPVQNAPLNPDEDYRQPSFGGGSSPTGLTGIEVLGHEYGHHWLVFSAFDQGNGLDVLHRADTRDSTDGSAPNRMASATLHYSHLADSRSVMFGNFITPLGNGQYRLEGGERKYGALDQYLMGLRAAEETPPLRVLDDGSGMGLVGTPLRRGESEVVNAQDEVLVSVADFIRAQGPRVPAFPTAPRCFRVAFVLVLAPGATSATSDQLAVVEAYRKRWEGWFFQATEGRAATVTSLNAATACPEPALAPAADGGTTEEPDAGNSPSVAPDAGLNEATDAGDDLPGTTKIRPGCGCTGLAGSALPAAWLLALLALRRKVVR
jgi:hypothetical protein